MISEQDLMKRSRMTTNDKFTQPTIEVASASQVRCQNCNRLFFKGDIKQGSSIEIKCPKCREIYKFAFI